MSSSIPPDIRLQEQEIAKLNESRPKPEFKFEPAPGGSLWTQVNQAEFARQNAEIDAQIAAVPERRAKARVEALLKFRRDFDRTARNSELRHAFWKSADRDYQR